MIAVKIGQNALCAILWLHNPKTAGIIVELEKAGGVE